MANKTEQTVKWEVQKRELQKRFAVITNSDVMFKPGQKDLMLEKLQIKLGKTKEQLDAIISKL